VSQNPVDLTFEELRRLDATYTPIPSFVQWSDGLPSTNDDWDRYVAMFDDVRAQLTTVERESLVHSAMRGAAVNTGAIEGLHTVDRGLTITVIEQAARWQAAVTEAAGPKAAELANAALEGYEMALDLATRREAISEAWIRQIHEVVCAPQESYRALTPQGWQEHPLPRGEYKTNPNHVRLGDGSFHAYAPVSSTSPEMHQLVLEVRGDTFLAAHPSLQTSYVHHAFARVHPFSDGNGRVARVLASVFTLRSAGVPFVVFDDQKALYFGSLELADKGRPERFVTFVSDRVVDILGLLVENARSSHTSAPALTERLTELLTGQGGLTLHELDAIAGRLRGILGHALLDAVRSVEAPPGVRIVQQSGGTAGGGSEQLRFPRAGTEIGGLLLISEAPAQAQVAVPIHVGIKKDPSDRRPFRAWATLNVGGAAERKHLELEPLEVRLDEIFPEATSMLQMRVTAWARGVAGQAFEVMVGAVQEALKASGL
jgi:Fic family protein